MAIDLRDQYLFALAFHRGQEQPPRTNLPLSIARACVDVLHLSGAGLTVFDSLRLPLAATNDDVRAAEAIQISLGDGPSLEVARTGRPVAATLGQMGQRWPVFHAVLRRDTPFRFVASLPVLRGASQATVALDLFNVDERGFGDLTVDDVHEQLTPCLRDLLVSAPDTRNDFGDREPSWLSPPSPNDRIHVWVAVGIMNSNNGVGPSDALALLRARAMTRDTTLDDIAHQVVSGELTVHEVC